MFSFETNNSHLYKVLCLKGNEALHLCMNEQCQRPAFVCSNKSCRCRYEHKNCYYAVASSVVEKVKSKVINTHQLQNKLAIYVKLMIDKMTNFYETLLKQFQAKSKYFGLMPIEKDFLQSLDELSINKITGNKIATICSNLKPNKQYYKRLQTFKDQINSEFDSFFVYLKQFQDSVYNTVQSMCQCNHLKYQTSKSSKNYISAQTISSPIQSYQSIMVQQKSQYTIKIEPKLFEKSKIIKSQTQENNIVAFFNKRKIKSTNLLYRASENGFSTKRFHVECDQVPNTLIICKTQNGRVIGGYSPLMWEIVKGQMSQQRDPSLNTFIFSLTENLKFTPIKLRQKSSAFGHISSGVSIIKHTSEFGPCFGKFEFVIKDEAHLEGENAWIKYEKNNPSFDYFEVFEQPRQYYKKILGSQNPYFRIREWEVWKIKFRNQSTSIKF